MDVKEAVRIAKSYLADLLSEERMENLGLEEVEFDEREGAWHITLGFSRPWNRKPVSAVEMALSSLNSKRELPSRDYRVVSVREQDGKVMSVKLHEIAA